MKQVPLDNSINKMLDEIAESRKKRHELVTTKKGIIASLVMLAHKREVKK